MTFGHRSRLASFVILYYIINQLGLQCRISNCKIYIIILYYIETVSIKACDSIV